MGGAIYQRAIISLYLRHCTFSDNQASEIGGAVAFDSKLYVISSTFNNNYASKMGGGIAVLEAGESSLITSTVSGNRTDSTGGGIVNFGTIVIRSGTITLNETESKGGGIHNAGAGFMEMENSIVAQNVSMGSNPDLSSTVPADLISEGYNLIGDLGSANLASQSSDILGTVFQPIDPMLLPLNTYGGEINIHPLSEGSPARCVGNPNLDSTYDQRGELRIAPLDIGSYESAEKCGSGGLPTHFANAFQLSPNPLRVGERMQLSYHMPEVGRLKLELLDLQGRSLFQTPSTQVQKEGQQFLQIPSNMPPGAYLVQIYLNDQLVGVEKLLCTH